MLACYFDKKDSWAIFSEAFPGFSRPAYKELALVLAPIKYLFEKFFGAERVHQIQHLSILHSVDTPQCFRGYNLIFLKVSCYPLQLIYQFTHELCHLMIQEEVPERFRWLEETFCELASFYFLEQIGSMQDDEIASPLLQSCKPDIAGYISDQMKTALPIGKTSESIRVSLDMLSKDPYFRNYNTAVANELFPIFRSHPNAWKIIPHLCEIPKNYSFDGGIHYLSTIVENECRDGMDCIVSLLLG